MKKLIFGIVTLVVLAGSTFSTLSSVQPNSTVAGVTKPKPSPRPTGPTTSSIPPPTCPYNDPNGCGILD